MPADRNIRALVAGLLGCTFAFTVACSHDTTTSDPAAPTALVITSGNLQSAGAGRALSAPLIVKVSDQYGAGVTNATVTFAVATGGGSVSPASATTDAQGLARTTWTLGATTGTQTVTAATSPLRIAQSVTFAATASDVSINGTLLLSSNAEGAELGFGSGKAPDAVRLLSRASLTGSSDDHVPGELLVTLRADAIVTWSAAAVSTRGGAATVQTQMMRVAQAMIDSTDGMVLRASAPLRYVVIRAPSDAAAAALMARLETDPRVESVEWNALIAHPTMRTSALEARDQTRASSAGVSGFTTIRGSSLTTNPAAPSALTEVVPNDPLWLNQAWHYRMIDLPAAWSRQPNASSVTVSVIDDGQRSDHPDLAGVFTSDGYNFVSIEPTDAYRACTTAAVVVHNPLGGRGPDATRQDSWALNTAGSVPCWARESLGGHGLHTSGTIAALAGNGVGGSGVAPGAKIRMLKVFGNKDLGGSSDDISQAILYAAGLPAVGANGQTVQTTRTTLVSMSLGGSSSTVMRNAVAAAVQAGVLIIAAAGNDQTTAAFYPASYSGVLSVAALGPDGAPARYSNGGSTVAVSAPGGDQVLWNLGSAGVLSSVWNFVAGSATYAYADGTSMATPHVTGVAALLLAAEPTLSAADLTARLTQYAMPALGTQRSDLVGNGTLNAYAALIKSRTRSERTQLRLVNSTTGDTVRTLSVTPGQAFSLNGVADGKYWLVAAQDRDSDGDYGGFGRRVAAFGSAAKPTEITVANGAGATANMLLSYNVEAEPNDTLSTANRLYVNSSIAARFDSPDVRDVYVVTLPKAGSYVFETAAVNGACGYGIELDTSMSLLSSAGAVLATNDDINANAGNYCSRITQTLQAGTYYVQVINSTGQTRRWRYRLSVKAS